MQTTEPNLTEYKKQQKEPPKWLRKLSGKPAAIKTRRPLPGVQPELIGMDQLDLDQLADLAEQANGAHKACEQAARSMLTHARDCGDVLNRAKGYFPHGKWEGWVAENCQFSIGQSRRYMRIARSWPELSKRARALDLNLEDFSMREAIRVLTSGDESDASPKAKAGPSIFVDMFCPSCGSQLVKTSAGIYVTCSECLECRLYPNPERRGQAERTPPILLAFEQWRKMPPEDKGEFLRQAKASAKSDTMARTLGQINRDFWSLKKKWECREGEDPAARFDRFEADKATATIQTLTEVQDRAAKIEREAGHYRAQVKMLLSIIERDQYDSEQAQKGMLNQRFVRHESGIVIHRPAGGGGAN